MGSKTTGKYNIDFCKDFANSEGYKILEKVYFNCKTNMTFVHLECNHKFEMDWEHFNRGQRCPKCADANRNNKTRLGIDFCKVEAEKIGYLVISNTYKNNQEKLIFNHFENNCNYTFEMSWGNFYGAGQRCPKCMGHVKLKIEDLKIMAQERGYKLLSNKFVNSFTYMDFQHLFCGNIYKAVWNNFRCGKGCPYCSSSKGEIEVSKILKSFGFELNKDFFTEQRFDDCRFSYPLPFDFYLPNYNLLIEYQGIQHFIPVDFAGRGEKWADKSFKENQEKDRIKMEYCLYNKINLLEISYEENAEEVLTNYFYG